MVIVHSAALTVDQAGFRGRVEALRAELAKLDPGVVRVGPSYYETHAPPQVSADRHSTLIPLSMPGNQVEPGGYEDRSGRRAGRTRERPGRLPRPRDRRGHPQPRLHEALGERPPDRRGDRHPDRTRDPAGGVRHGRGRARAARAGDLRDHRRAGAGRADRPDLPAQLLRRQHAHVHGPGGGDRLLPVHRVALPRGAAARARAARGDRRRRHDREPRGAVQRHDGGARARGDADRPDEDLRQPCSRRHPRGARGGHGGTDRAPGHPQPAGRPDRIVARAALRPPGAGGLGSSRRRMGADRRPGDAPARHRADGRRDRTAGGGDPLLQHPHGLGRARQPAPTAPWRSRGSWRSTAISPSAISPPP